MATYYKTGRYTEDGIVSWIAKGAARVAYKINERADAPAHLLSEGYGLLVFRELLDARMFVAHYGWEAHPILEVEADTELPLKYMAWIDDDGRIVMETESCWPVGTAIVPYLTPLRLVEVRPGGYEI